MGSTILFSYLLDTAACRGIQFQSAHVLAFPQVFPCCVQAALVPYSLGRVSEENLSSIRCIIICFEENVMVFVIIGE